MSLSTRSRRCCTGILTFGLLALGTFAIFQLHEVREAGKTVTSFVSDRLDLVSDTLSGGNTSHQTLDPVTIKKEVKDD